MPIFWRPGARWVGGIVSAGVHLEANHLYAEPAEIIEDAVQSRLVDQFANEHCSGGDLLLLDAVEGVAELLVQSPINPDTESATAILFVLVM